jgi:exonuclease SbcD
MRLLHTADWHLGRTLGGESFLPDQSWLLHGQFLQILREARPDVLLVAGDVFDRAIPPTEAVELLDTVLAEVVLNLGVPTVLIPGNHDAAERLSFGAKVMQERGLHIAASALGAPIPFADEHGEVWVLPSGYASPLLIAELMGTEAGVTCHDSGFGAICTHLRGMCPAGARLVMVAHAFLQDGQESESERLLQVGGARAVSASRFDGMHYVALGHLHRPQSLAEGRIRYSGSPLAYSFSEAGHGKSVTLVEIGADGTARTEEIPLTPPRRLRTLEGRLSEVLDMARSDWRRDWMRVRLTDADPVWGAMDRLREEFPHVLELAFARHETLDGPAGETGPGARRDDPLALLEEFYVQMKQRPLTDAGRAVAREAIVAAQATEG